MKQILPVSIEEELYFWILDCLNNNRDKFRNRSHLVETALEQFRNGLENGENNNKMD